MFPQTLLIVLICTSSGFAGYVPSGGYLFHQNPIYHAPQPVFHQQLAHYPQPSFVQFHRPQQVTTVSQPQFVAVHAERPQQQVASVTRPPFVAIQADRPQTAVVATPRPPTLVQQYPNVVAIQAERAPQFRKLVLPYPPQEYYTVPNYSYGYSVKDEKTGDEKSHQETRTGDNVVGKYTVVEPDGTLRTVSYTAGAEGFNAVVERTANYAAPNAPSKPLQLKPVISGIFSKPLATAVAVPVSSNYPTGFHFGG